jgi:hypothetical protein
MEETAGRLTEALWACGAVFGGIFGLYFDTVFLLQKSCLEALYRAIWMAVWRRFGWLLAGRVHPVSSGGVLYGTPPQDDSALM